MNDIRYFELELGNKSDKGFRTGDYENPFSMAIKATHYPNFDEVEEFYKDDLELVGYDGVHSITEITEEEVYKYFDTSLIDTWKVLGG